MPDRAPPPTSWSIELPAGWQQLPVDGGDVDVLVAGLAARLGAEPDAPVGTAAALGALAEDVRAGARLAAWSAQTVVGDRPRSEGGRLTAQRIGRLVLTTLSASRTPPPGAGTPIGGTRTVDLQSGVASLQVAVTGDEQGRLLVVHHEVEASDGPVHLVGRTPNLTLADPLVRTLHLIARSFAELP